MADKIHGFLPVTAEPPNDNQRLFIRYFTGILLDLVILNLFAEFTDKVHVESFSWSLLAAIILQFLLKGTIWVEHKVAEFFSKRPGGFMKFMRFFGAWFVLFLSKFVILEVLTLALGDKLHFEGIMHGVVWLIIVVTVMVVGEELIVRLFRKIR